MRVFLFFLLFVCNEIFAQSYAIKRIETSVNGIPGEMKGVPGDIFNCKITYTNTGSGVIHVFMNRYQKSIPPYWSSCYCYIQCASPLTDTATIEVQPFSTAEVTLPFKTDSVNPGQATSSFKVYQVGYESKPDTIHMLASTLNNLVGISEKFPGKTFNIFPNPASGFLNISGNAKNLEEVYIFDLSGKVLFHRADIHKEFISINTNELDPGIYLIQVKSGGEIVKEKFSINR